MRSISSKLQRKCFCPCHTAYCCPVPTLCASTTKPSPRLMCCKCSQSAWLRDRSRYHSPAELNTIVCIIKCCHFLALEGIFAIRNWKKPAFLRLLTVYAQLEPKQHKSFHIRFKHFWQMTQILIFPHWISFKKMNPLHLFSSGKESNICLESMAIAWSVRRPGWQWLMLVV